MKMNYKKLLIFLFLLVISCSLINCLNRDARIVIIGAGAAGITAASNLIKNGYTNVTIYESLSRIGGRIHSKKIKGNIFELGAQWFV